MKKTRFLIFPEKNDSFIRSHENVLQKNVALESSENLRKYVVEKFL